MGIIGILILHIREAPTRAFELLELGVVAALGVLVDVQLWLVVSTPVSMSTLPPRLTV